ncbi:protein JASON isoform X1, partial [Fagus crenata]
MPSLSSSCISSVHNTGRVSFSSTEGSGTGSVNTAVRVHANQTETIAINSVQEQVCSFQMCFDGSSSRSSSENVSQNRNKSELLGDQSVSKPSPYPTPLSNPVDGDSQWKLLKEEDSNSHQLLVELRESTATPGSEGGVKESLSGKDLKDQKVSWHATPFEERLEKALSEESVITQRKHIYGKLIAFDENEEGDTALSQLQSSNHP